MVSRASPAKPGAVDKEPMGAPVRISDRWSSIRTDEQVL